MDVANQNVDWLSWMAENNVKLQPIIDKFSSTRWRAAVVTLAGDGWTNVVRPDALEFGNSPSDALKNLKHKIDNQK